MGRWEIAVMAMILSSVTGFMLAEGERKRILYVQAMRRCLMRLADMIRYEPVDLQTMLLRINLQSTMQEKQLTVLLHAAAERLSYCANPQLVRVFRSECSRNAGYGVLNAGDKEAFETLLGDIGRTGLQEQLRLIEAADERLGRREHELVGDCARRERLIRTLGLTGGAAAFLLLV